MEKLSPLQDQLVRMSKLSKDYDHNVKDELDQALQQLMHHSSSSDTQQVIQQVTDMQNVFQNEVFKVKYKSDDQKKKDDWFVCLR